MTDKNLDNHDWTINGPDPENVEVPEYLTIARNHLANRGHDDDGKNYPGLGFGPYDHPDPTRRKKRPTEPLPDESWLLIAFAVVIFWIMLLVIAFGSTS